MKCIKVDIKTIMKNLTSNTLNRMIAYLFSFLMIIYSARVFQPETYGKISFVTALVGIFVFLANLGMPIYGMRLCKEYKDNAEALDKTVNELWSICIVLSVLSTTTLICLTLFVPRLHLDWLLFLLFGSGILLQAFNFEWLFKGLEQFRFLSVCQFTIKLVSLICMVVFVRSPRQLLLYALLYMMAEYGSGLIAFFRARKHVHFSLRLSFNRRHIRPLVFASTSLCCVSIIGSLDLTMLGFMMSDCETGLYSLALIGRIALTTIGSIVCIHSLPRAINLWETGHKKRLEALAGKTIVIVSMLQFAVMVVCMIFARLIMVLIGGNAFEGATFAFRILLLSLLPIGIGNIIGLQLLTTTGRESCFFRAEIVGLILNFMANLFVIPRFSIEGAAATTVFSEIVVAVLCFVSAKQELDMNIGLWIANKIKYKIEHLIDIAFIKPHGRSMKRNFSFYCPCCGAHLRRFINGGYTSGPEDFNPARYFGIDPKVICPNCGSMPRHRILTLWMELHTDELKGKKILHFAQESCIRIWMDKNGISATTADLYAPADLQLDIEDTKLPDESYDVIICNHVLEHVSDYRKALCELHRIVASDGMVIISFPTDMKLETVYEDVNITDEEGRIEHFGQSDHLRVFGRDSASMLESFGFEVEEITSDDERIKPVVGPADYDYNVLWLLRKK